MCSNAVTRCFVGYIFIADQRYILDRKIFRSFHFRRQKYGVPFEKTDLEMTLKVMGKVKSKVTILLPGKNPTTLVQVIFLCDAYFSNYPAVPELLTHPV